MCDTIRNSMHGVLLLPSLKKQRELLQRLINKFESGIDTVVVNTNANKLKWESDTLLFEPFRVTDMTFFFHMMIDCVYLLSIRPELARFELKHGSFEFSDPAEWYSRVKRCVRFFLL